MLSLSLIIFHNFTAVKCFDNITKYIKFKKSQILYLLIRRLIVYEPISIQVSLFFPIVCLIFKKGLGFFLHILWEVLECLKGLFCGQWLVHRAFFAIRKITIFLQAKVRIKWMLISNMLRYFDDSSL